MASILALAACDGGADVIADAAPADVADLSCPVGREKIAFSRVTGCDNDGAVSIEIPTADTQGILDVEAVHTDIRCRPYMNDVTICSYPLRWQEHCVGLTDAMTEAVWDDMCQLAAIPGVVDLVGFVAL